MHTLPFSPAPRSRSGAFSAKLVPEDVASGKQAGNKRGNKRTSILRCPRPILNPRRPNRARWAGIGAVRGEAEWDTHPPSSAADTVSSMAERGKMGADWVDWAAERWPDSGNGTIGAQAARGGGEKGGEKGTGVVSEVTGSWGGGSGDGRN